MNELFMHLVEKARMAGPLLQRRQRLLFEPGGPTPINDVGSAADAARRVSAKSEAFTAPPDARGGRNKPGEREHGLALGRQDGALGASHSVLGVTRLRRSQGVNARATGDALDGEPSATSADEPPPVARTEPQRSQVSSGMAGPGDEAPNPDERRADAEQTAVAQAGSSFVSQVGRAAAPARVPGSRANTHERTLTAATLSRVGAAVEPSPLALHPVSTKAAQSPSIERLGRTARRWPAAGATDRAPLAPAVHVSIGRVEVRVPAPPESPRVPQAQGPKLSLQDYLKKTHRGTR